MLDAPVAVRTGVPCAGVLGRIGVPCAGVLERTGACAGDMLLARVP